jgi:hypothetical protein
MVKVFFPCVLLCLTAALAQAQIDSYNSILAGNTAQQEEFSPHEFFSGRKNISLETEYYFGSNAITSKFFTYYYLNRYIDNGLKTDVSERLDETGNRFGSEFKTSLRFTYKTKTTKNFNTLYYAGICNRNFIDALFTRDAFELYFRGNSAYRGRTARFDDFKLRIHQYQKITWGLMNIATGDSSKVSFGYSGSFLVGQFMKDVSISGNLFTAQNGEYLDVNASGNLHASDSAHTKLTSLNGMGASVDFYFHYRMNDDCYLNFSVNDFGFMNWNNNTSLVSVDTSFHFEGVEVNDLFDFSDSVFTSSSLTDSAQAMQFLNHRSRQNYSQVLPVHATVDFVYHLSEEKIFFTLHDEMMTGKAFRNLAAIGMGWKGKNAVVSAELSYGGYGNLNAGLTASFLVLKNYSLTIGSHAVNGYIAPAVSTAQGVFVMFKKYL